ncbi:SMP-30/gluconolactonase/LRE family protein [Haladaptatus salinisoli]|uniref:SMP-30/gluconolactonase/LRE family protein n=1 Tax=Haladaptatus salinisoli TaxID=2884876 RepID=UPI001D0BB261|nr:SMP-30/gluconolactonase/LRE family protein [Haladaptatus salinisoli]
MEPQLIANTRCRTGEGPLWHPDREIVYWVDIPRGRLFSYDPATGEHELRYEDSVISALTLQADGSLLLFMDRGRILRWDDDSTTPVVDGIPAERDSRFNDVIADPEGRIFCGTMPTDDRLGRLYRLDRDGSIVELDDGYDIPNGMGFTPDGTGLYLTESNARRIYRFEYDATTGDLSDRRVFVETPEHDGVPDGMTVDADGNVWSARWNGHRVVRYAPDGTVIGRIELPVKKVSCPTFGGSNYADLYVTTAGGDDEGDEAGALFRISEAGSGVPEFRSRIAT